MQKIFYDTRILDEKSRERFSLSQELMMENAAMALEQVLSEKTFSLVLVGPGNNGADGYAFARRIFCCEKNSSNVVALECEKAKSELCVLQKARAKKSGVKILSVLDFDFFDSENWNLAQMIFGSIENFLRFDFIAIFDCVFGSGFRGELDSKIVQLFSFFNNAKNFFGKKLIRVACDCPSGISLSGKVSQGTFCADITISMGALKSAFFSDAAKDFCGKIIVLNLGISRENFESENEIDAYLIEEKDFFPPKRKSKNCNKGDFGSVTVFAGEKSGAAIMAAQAALRFGCGTSTIVGKIENGFFLDAQIMLAEKFPEKNSVVILGPGFGFENSEWEKAFSFLKNHPSVALVADADSFYKLELKNFLECEKNRLFDFSSEDFFDENFCEKKSNSRRIVLTPHPKEFQAFFEICFSKKITIEEIQKNRILLSKEFANLFPGVVLVLKGANPVIAAADKNGNAKVFICDFGTAALSKAGSGDILSGLIASLLAQGRNPFSAAKNAVIAHALASQKIFPEWSLSAEKLLSECEKAGTIKSKD